MKHPPRLRDYQVGLIEKLQERMGQKVRRILLQSPTGSGKTVLTAHMQRTALERGLSSWFLVHRKELVRQTSDALWDSGVPHGTIAAGSTTTRDLVQVATVQSLARRVEKLHAPKLIIVDEAHHTTAKTYRKILDACAGAYVIGLTATPCRTDGTGLSDLFDDLILGPSVAWLMEQGWLSPYRVTAPPNHLDLRGVRRRGGDWARNELEPLVTHRAVVGDAVDHYQRLVKGSCLVYCVSRVHARLVEAAYRSAGVDARYCAADTPAQERDAMVAGFRDGDPPVIVSVDLFGEGLDVPALDAVQLLRPTESLGLHLQQIGRALRPEANKRYAFVLDHVGNTWRHGLPDDEREWTLEGRPGAKKAPIETGPAIRTCERCFSVYRASLRACPICGFYPIGKPRLPQHVDGQLVEVAPEEHRRTRADAKKDRIRRARGMRALVALAVENGYLLGWAAGLHKRRTGRPLGELMAEEKRIRLELAMQEGTESARPGP